VDGNSKPEQSPINPREEALDNIRQNEALFRKILAAIRADKHASRLVFMDSTFNPDQAIEDIVKYEYAPILHEHSGHRRFSVFSFQKGPGIYHDQELKEDEVVINAGNIGHLSGGSATLKYKILDTGELEFAEVLSRSLH